MIEKNITAGVLKSYQPKKKTKKTKAPIPLKKTETHLPISYCAQQTKTMETPKNNTTIALVPAHLVFYR
jgi:hypothetical protein